MRTEFSVPMTKSIILMLLAAEVVCAAAIVWAFMSGLTWTGICLLAVVGPLTAIFWYMLYINPSNSVVALTEEGVYIQAPPFFKATIPYGEIQRTFEGNLKTDAALALVKEHRVMRYGPYRSGHFELPSGKEAYVLTNSDEVFGMETAERIFLIGCQHREDLRQYVEAKS